MTNQMMDSTICPFCGTPLRRVSTHIPRGRASIFEATSHHLETASFVTRLPAIMWKTYPHCMDLCQSTRAPFSAFLPSQQMPDTWVTANPTGLREKFFWGSTFIAQLFLGLQTMFLVHAPLTTKWCEYSDWTTGQIGIIEPVTNGPPQDNGSQRMKTLSMLFQLHAALGPCSMQSVAVHSQRQTSQLNYNSFRKAICSNSRSLISITLQQGMHWYCIQYICSLHRKVCWAQYYVITYKNIKKAVQAHHWTCKHLIHQRKQRPACNTSLPKIKTCVWSSLSRSPGHFFFYFTCCF